ncbi:MAG: hypothetical protein UZ12_BCD005000752 [Bacteroidetes bacterium OLB12]|nr:MAG: hypothetical protein UZ12_BCD005000752 [Bacteroidetes bacterium OLB12]
MELRDLIVTPLLLIVVYLVAYFIRPYVTDSLTSRYFLPALTFKIIGAISLGLIYQFYYDGGDTFSYHTHGSRQIWEAFMDSPLQGIKLLWSNDNHVGVYQYSSRIYFFNDDQSYFLIRIAALFDLLTFSSYSATAVFFALLSFIGMWLFFLTFYSRYPHLHRGLAVAALFLPSVFFGDREFLKDTLTIAGLGVATYCFYQLLLVRKFSLRLLLALIVALVVIFSVKKFVLQAFLPAVLVWVVAYNFSTIKALALKIILVPVAVCLVVIGAYYMVVKVGQDDERYALNKLAKTAKVTAYDIRYWSGRFAGSGYALGELDGTFGSMLRLAPQAINVSLFRPYLWEVKNPLMLISALESFAFLSFTLYVLFGVGSRLRVAFSNPDVIFGLVFSLSFAFAVGVSTFNFGTLARYKIPLLPFYLVALVIMLDYRNKPRNVAVLERTE